MNENIWDHPYITSAKGLGSEKWQFLFTFSADVGWVGKKSPKMCWSNIGMVLMVTLEPSSLRKGQRCLRKRQLSSLINNFSPFHFLLYLYDVSKHGLRTAAQIQIPNKYLGCRYKGLVFSRNNGWIMENMGKGLTIPRWVTSFTHCYFTRLNLKKWGLSNFAFQSF